MRKSLVVVFLSSMTLFACGGAATKEAKSEADVWADFKGTYSTPGTPSAEKADKGDTAKKDAKAKTASKDKAAPKAEETKKVSKGTINGESLSTLTVESLTDASKSTLKGKLVSNSVITGSQYEVVSVQLKGTTVQIIRPAATPAPSGPNTPSPKAKTDSLGKNEAGWYDEEADVAVIVQGGKKGAAQKALATLVKH